MAEVVFLTYEIIFDPNQTWKRFVDFETDLVKFFNDRNLDAEILSNLPEQPPRHMIYVRKKKDAVVPPEVQSTPQIGLQKSLKNIQNEVKKNDPTT